MSSKASCADAANRSTPPLSFPLSWDNFDYAAIKLNVNEVHGIVELNLDFRALRYVCARSEGDSERRLLICNCHGDHHSQSAAFPTFSRMTLNLLVRPRDD